MMMAIHYILKIYLAWFITLPTKALVKYCDEHICVRVCTSVCLYVQ